MKSARYCDNCDKDTIHDDECIKDAEKPPEEFIEAESEGYANQGEVIFYANGDSIYKVTCTECGKSYEEM